MCLISPSGTKTDGPLGLNLAIQDPNKQYKHFAGYVDEGKTYLEYSKKPKFMDLKGALAPVSIKSMKHGPSFNTVQVNKFVYKAQMLCLGRRDKGNLPKKIGGERRCLKKPSVKR